MTEHTIMLFGVGMILLYLIAMIVHKIGRCPKCNCQMHRLIDSNTWMCENTACRYCEIRR